MLSGPEWCKQFPTSKSIEDLSDPFRSNCRKFIDALHAAGATISIGATYRPVERAWLMHYSWQVAKQVIAPDKVPTHPSVDIQWVHPTLQESISAANSMVKSYGIVYAPAIESRHSDRVAIDMTINWVKLPLNIAKSDGSTVSIHSSPSNGQNPFLHDVGKSYGVIKLLSDPPHWSIDGH